MDVLYRYNNLVLISPFAEHRFYLSALLEAAGIYFLD